MDTFGPKECWPLRLGNESVLSHCCTISFDLSLQRDANEFNTGPWYNFVQRLMEPNDNRAVASENPIIGLSHCTGRCFNNCAVPYPPRINQMVSISGDSIAQRRSAVRSSRVPAVYKCILLWFGPRCTVWPQRSTKRMLSLRFSGGCIPDGEMAAMLL